MATSHLQPTNPPEQQPQPSLTFYPAFCHELSPTYFTWVKIAAVDVHKLQSRRGFEEKRAWKGQNLYFHLNHPIQFIHLAGIIISRDELPTRTIFLLDDSSGETIEVVCPKVTAPNNSNPSTTSTPSTHVTYKTSTPINLLPLQPSTLAKLKGTITTFRGIKQVSLERYTVLTSMAQEIRFWEERSRFLVDVLSVPWEVGEGEVRRLRARAESGGGQGQGRGGGAGTGGRGGDVERRKRREEREEKDRLRIERRYAREEIVRHKLAVRCRAASAAAVHAVSTRGKKK
ncbi:hypothetical protein FQN54_004115 [Arachnomyces sp. PD_36]|nr:hypothetical protein FQN54_004115 [Arachnomyces sp. PD_36]